MVFNLANINVTPSHARLFCNIFLLSKNIAFTFGVRKVSNYKKILTRTQKVLYRVKSGYFATQLKPAVERVLSFLGRGIRWAWSI